MIRKLVILTREAGYQVEQKDVKLECIIPEKYFEGTPDDFRNSVTEMDAVFETRRHMAPGRM